MRWTLPLLSIFIIALHGCAPSASYTRLAPSSWGLSETLLGVRSVTQRGAASVAGVRTGDLIVAVDSEKVDHVEIFTERVQKGQGPLLLTVLRKGAEWQFTLPENARKNIAGLSVAPMYRVLSNNDPPLALFEGTQAVVTSWVNTSSDLTVVDLEIENLTQKSLEITPNAVTVLDGKRALVRPYHPRELAQSYFEDAEYAFRKARQQGGTGGRVSVNISGQDPITGLLSLLLNAGPIYTLRKNLEGARESSKRAEAIMDRAYRFGEIPAQASQEGLLFYPNIKEMPMTLIIQFPNESFALVFDQP